MGVVTIIIIIIWIACLYYPSWNTNRKFYNYDMNRVDANKELLDATKNNLKPSEVRRNIVNGKYDK